MFKTILSIFALSAFTIAPVSAEIRRISEGYYVATDSSDRSHYIDYVRMDHEGDVQIRVIVNGDTQYYWVSCVDDRISIAGDDYNGWHYVDHRKMEGYYSDVACGRR